VNLKQRVFLGLGSNLPDREQHLALARESLARSERFTLLRESAIYETAPIGFVDQPAFLNQVIAGLWEGSPKALHELTKQIEADAGRERPFPNAPRTLDIDILFWEGPTIESDRLIVPHPRLTERAFALVPLLEIAPDLVDPHTGKLLSTYLTSDLFEQEVHILESETAGV